MQCRKELLNFSIAAFRLLFRERINFYAKDIDDIYSEMYYTATVWNMVAWPIASHRLRNVVYPHKYGVLHQTWGR